MRRSTLVLALAVGALLGLAQAQIDVTIGLGETRTGTIPTEQIDHRYVLTLPAGVPRVTISVSAGGADADMAVSYLPTGEQLFLDVSLEPNPSFTMEAPRSGSYEILVKNLLWQPLSYVLRVSGDAGAGAPPPAAPADEYYVVVDGAAVGPTSLAALEERIARGATVAEDLVWRPGLDAWVRADALPELAERFASRPAPPPLPPSVGAVPAPIAPPGDVPPNAGDVALPDLRVTVGCRESARDAALRGLPVGERALVTCPAGCGAAVVWGTDAYTDDSTICSAAMHAGLIDLAHGGAFVLTIEAGRSSYEGSVRHGISTRPYGSWSRGFALAGLSTAPVDRPRDDAAAKPDKPAVGPGAGASAPNPGRLAAERLALGTLRGTLSSAATEARHVVTVDRDGDLEIRAVADLNVVLYLYDANGSTLASHTSGYATERVVRRTGVAPGAYTVAISRDGGNGQGAFSITVELVANATRDDDEPNDAAGEARSIPVDALASGRLGYGGAGRRDTEDWFRLTTLDDGDLTVGVDADPELQIVLHLYGAEGRATLATDTSGWSSSRSVTVQGLVRGSYLLRVSRDGNDGEGGYGVAPSFAAASTANDAEPNDTREQAQAVAAGALHYGRLGYGDGSRTDTEDFVVLTTTRPGDLSLSVRAELNVVLVLTDANGSTLATDTSGYSGQRTVARADLPAGRYVLRIARDGSSGRGGYVLEPRFSGR